MKFILGVILCLGSIRFALSQIYGPGNCLINRLDVIPCEFRHRRLIRPELGEQGAYSTNLRSGSAGSPICRVRPINQTVLPINNFENRINFINSPGYRTFPQIEYPDQQLVLYRINCGEGFLSYFDLLEINLEEPNCADPSLERNRCVDYISIDNSPFGNFEVCGSNVSLAGDTSPLQSSNLEVTFRSSTEKRFSGFSASVVCFRPEDANLPGCTQGVMGMNTTSMDSEQQRRKREADKKDLEEFHNRWKRKLADIKRRRKRQDIDEEDLRFIEINVPYEVNVMYNDDTLKFVDSETNTPLPNTAEFVDIGLTDIEGILALHTFDANGTADDFIRSFSDTESIPGPGPIFIVGRDAFFQLFIIDPRGILPSAEEAAAITNITSAQLAVFPVEPDIPLSFLNRDPVDPAALGLPPARRRRKRKAPSSSNKSRSKRQGTNVIEVDDSVFSDESIIMALMNENACNAPLRESARATIAFVEGRNPDRLTMLRNSLMTSSGDDTTSMPTTIDDP